MATHTHSPTTEPDPARIQSSDSTPDLPHATSSRFSSSPISTADSFSEETSLQTISTESTPKSETDPEHRETIAATIAGEGGLERTDCGSADSDQGSTTQTASEEDEDEEDEKEEEQFGGDGIQGGRPLLVAQWMASLGTPTDKDYGLHTRTPTRSRRGGRTIDHFARRTTRSTSSRPEPDDLLAYLRKKSDIDTGEEPGDTEGLIFESNKAEFLNEDGDEEEDGDEIPLPKTPSKSRPPLRDLQATMMRESPRTPGSWLDRWKYNIIMTHTTMKPPTILTEKEIDSVEDDDEESTPFEDSTEAGLMTPTRKWTRQPREPDLARLLATDTKAETDETSDDDVEKVNESLGRRMKRSIAEDEDVNDLQQGQDDKVGKGDDEHEAFAGMKKLPRLDFKSPRRMPMPMPMPIPLVELQELSSSDLHTPPRKVLVHKDLSMLKPPPAPKLSGGKLPMYSPHDNSCSPSNRRRYRVPLDVPPLPMLSKPS